MEDSKKKPIMISVIVVSLGVAGLVTYTKHSGGGNIDDISAGQTTWVKCNNKACNAEYEMDKKQFYKEIEAHRDHMAMTTPAMTCEKCGKPSAFAAIKCANSDCAVIFFKGSVPNDFADRCPACKQSADEKRRNARKAAG